MQQMPHLELILIGIGSCVVFDVWQRIFQIFTSIQPSNWALVGRWFIGLISNGQLIAKQLSQQPEAKHETPTGWAVHYAVSIAYAYVLFFLVRLGILEPTVTHGFFLEWLACWCRGYFLCRQWGMEFWPVKRLIQK